MNKLISAFLVVCLLQLAQSKVVDLSCKQVREFIYEHNVRRLKLAKGEVSGQPAATEMKYMVWDDELAAKAAKWASNNQFLHNPDKNIESNRFQTGENLYMSWSTKANDEVNIDDVLTSWFNEHEDYKYGPLKQSDFNSSKKAIGHYTQVAWSDSNNVGCAISENFKNDFKEHLVVCNYGPSGNYIDQTPYKSHGTGSEKLICYNDDCKRPFGKYCS